MHTRTNSTYLQPLITLRAINVKQKCSKNMTKFDNGSSDALIFMSNGDRLSNNLTIWDVVGQTSPKI